MNNLGAMAAVFASSLLLGCVAAYDAVPAASSFPPVEQYKLQSAAHWQEAATRMAKRMSANLKEPRPLYLHPVPAGSPFAQVYANQLSEALLDEGFAVRKTPGGALTVEMTTQAIRFLAERPAHRAAEIRSEDATPSQTEVVVTVTVSDATRQLFKRSEVYYVADGDGRLYEAVAARREWPTRHFAVVGQ
ncbi:MAG: hypothetical protein JNL84_05995 [Candidatus Accumulibacter sp.]|nr:hypothetical protein [Accumulibacter sp.]